MEAGPEQGSPRMGWKVDPLWGGAVGGGDPLGGAGDKTVSGALSSDEAREEGENGESREAEHGTNQRGKYV